MVCALLRDLPPSGRYLTNPLTTCSRLLANCHIQTFFSSWESQSIPKETCISSPSTWQRVASTTSCIRPCERSQATTAAHRLPSRPLLYPPYQAPRALDSSQYCPLPPYEPGSPFVLSLSPLWQLHSPNMILCTGYHDWTARLVDSQANGCWNGVSTLAHATNPSPRSQEPQYSVG